MLAISIAAAVPGALDVPYVRQVRAGCGSAAVAMVMQYWVKQQPSLDAVAADVERIDRVLPASGKGLHGKELQAYLEEHGFSAFLFTGETSDLENHLAKGRPVIVCIAPKGLRSPLHFAVVVGLEQSAVLLNDPARGKLISVEREEFERSWKLTENWALLAVPKQSR